MGGCVTTRCSRPALKDYLFCKECRRLLNDDDRHAMRMIAQSPALGPSAWKAGEEVVHAWPREGGAVDTYATAKNCAAIMHWAEYQMACVAIGKRIGRIYLRQAAKRRVSLRRR